jgi:PadR family transcriptional regulator, regulatory protein PadR
MSSSLGEFEQLVLLALMRLGDDGYGASVEREIEERAGRAVSLAAVYTTLMRMEQKGLVESRMGDPSPQRGGRRKKLYRILPSGQRELATSLAALRRMTKGLTPRLELR